MKNKFLCVASQTLVCLLLPAAICYGQDDDLPKVQRYNAVIRKYVDLTFQNAGTNEQLQQLAKKGEINILADATRFGEQPQTLTIREEDNLGMWLDKIGNEQKLSWDRQGEGTFLFWSEPDIPTLAQALVDDTELNRLAISNAEIARNLYSERLDPTLDAPNLQPVAEQRTATGITETDFVRMFSRMPMEALAKRSDKINQAIASELEKFHGWNRKSSEFSLDLRLSQLSPPLVEQIKTFTLKGREGRVEVSKLWFSDSFWNQARMAIRRNTGQVPVVTLTIAVPEEQGQKMLKEPLDERQRSDLMDWFSQPFERRLALWPDRPEATRQLPPRPRNPLSVQPKREPSAAGLVQNVTPGVIDVLESLSQDAKLDAPITLDVRDKPLPEFLAQVQEQSKVKLHLAPNSDLSGKRVTSALEAMPLKSLMTALSRLYGSRWNAQGEGYELRSDARLLARRALFSLGQRFRFWHEPMAQHNAPARLTLDPLPDWQGDFEIVGLGDAVVSPQGVAFTELPAELATKIKRAVQTEVGQYLIGVYSGVEGLDADLKVEVRSKPVRRSAKITANMPEAVREQIRAGAQPSTALEVNLRDEFDLRLSSFRIDDFDFQQRKRMVVVAQQKARLVFQQNQEAAARRNGTPQGANP